MWIAVSGAVVVGSLGGGLAALYSSAPPMEAPRTPPAAGPVVRPLALPTPPAAPVPPVAAPPGRRDPEILLAMQMTIVLNRFEEWSRDHAGAPCPDRAALGADVLDPWGHPIELTCTEQPAGQVVGAVSAGRDGIAGNDDDVTSWTLGAEVTDLVRGARWPGAPAPTAKAPAAAAPAATPPPDLKRKSERSGMHDHGPARPSRPAGPPPSGSTKPSALPGDAGADDIPARR